MIATLGVMEKAVISEKGTDRHTYSQRGLILGLSSMCVSLKRPPYPASLMPNE